VSICATAKPAAVGTGTLHFGASYRKNQVSSRRRAQGLQSGGADSAIASVSISCPNCAQQPVLGRRPHPAVWRRRGRRVSMSRPSRRPSIRSGRFDASAGSVAAGTLHYPQSRPQAHDRRVTDRFLGDSQAAPTPYEAGPHDKKRPISCRCRRRVSAGARLRSTQPHGGHSRRAAPSLAETPNAAAGAPPASDSGCGMAAATRGGHASPMWSCDLRGASACRWARGGGSERLTSASRRPIAIHPHVMARPMRLITAANSRRSSPRPLRQLHKKPLVIHRDPLAPTVPARLTRLRDLARRGATLISPS